MHLRRIAVKNYKALRSVELTDLTPLTVLIGPNKGGKSSILDVFGFLSDCFNSGLSNAWKWRGKAKGLKTWGQSGPVVIELDYAENDYCPLCTYHLEVDESGGRPFVVEEWLSWMKGDTLFRLFDYKNGCGGVERSVPEKLYAPDVLAADALGRLSGYEQAATLREFVAGWSVVSLAAPLDYDALKILGVEEPENSIYPRLVPDLAEKCYSLSERSQVFVITYSPVFVDCLDPREVVVVSKDELGHSKVACVSEIDKMLGLVRAGASIGELWMDGRFGVDPC